MKRLIGAVLALYVLVPPASAQNSVFGKNKVQYKDFQWEFIQTDHFDVYYSQDGYELASFAADAAEAAYNHHKKLLRYEINNRISIVVYNSHNEFQQTNVLDEYLEEGVGGVTELFKNRVVVPFEGSYSQFRHVIAHELIHAILNDMFYGGSIQSLVTGRMPEIPMWMNEGLAEYASLGWDANSDMFMRDATVHNYLPPIDYLGGYFAYRGGQSVWHYIATKYGEQKISEIIHRSKGTRSFEQAFRSTLGLSIKELSDRWQKEQKVLYWPDVATREEPADFSHKQLTFHVKDGNFYNTSPAISPQGDKIAYLSDRNDYFDIYLMSAIDGEVIKKLVSGQRTKNFEELHIITPGITWSPDGKKIALAVKAGERDAIMVIDVDSGDQEKIEPELDGIFSVAWSPDGDNIAFQGIKAPQSDIYIYNIKTKELTNLTDDIFSDFDPVYSPDGKTIFFSSDRRGYTDPATIPSRFRISDFDYNQRDLYSIDVATRKMTRITDYPNSDEVLPIPSPDGKKLLYISDRNGINNIYLHDLQAGTDVPITNSISAIYQLSASRDGSKLVFSSLNEAGFDIYLMLRPFDRKLSVTELEPTEYVKQKLALPRQEKPKEVLNTTISSDTVSARNNIIVLADTTDNDSQYRGGSKVDLKNYVFSQGTIPKDTIGPPPITKFEVVNNQDSEGNYVPHKYKLNFTPDLVYGTANYNTFYGLQGTTLMAFSDMLGDHQIVFQTNLLLDLKNSDYGLSYFYLPDRTDYGFQAFHTARFLILNDYLYRFTSWGLVGSASYPIDRFTRLDFSLNWLNLARDNLDDPTEPSQDRSFVLPSLSYVNDNSIWQGGWFAPNNGSRFNFTFYGSTKYNNNALDLYTYVFDYRDYTKFLHDYVFAFRLSGGLSDGANRQFFFIGGTDGWINRQFNNGTIPIVNVEDYAFLTPVLPLRGFDYNAQNGTRFLLTNLEVRFPLVRYLILGALPVGFQNILGAAFIDMGSAWSNTSEWQGFTTDASGSTVMNDLLVGTGFGARLFFLGFPLRIDVAWRFNWQGFSEPVYYFSLGAEY